MRKPSAMTTVAALENSWKWVLVKYGTVLFGRVSGHTFWRSRGSYFRYVGMDILCKFSVTNCVFENVFFCKKIIAYSYLAQSVPSLSLFN